MKILRSFSRLTILPNIPRTASILIPSLLCSPQFGKNRISLTIRYPASLPVPPAPVAPAATAGMSLLPTSRRSVICPLRSNPNSKSSTATGLPSPPNTVARRTGCVTPSSQTYHSPVISLDPGAYLGTDIAHDRSRILRVRRFDPCCRRCIRDKRLLPRYRQKLAAGLRQHVGPARLQPLTVTTMAFVLGLGACDVVRFRYLFDKECRHAHVLFRRNV